MKNSRLFCVLIIVFLLTVATGNVAYSAGTPLLPPSAIIKASPPSGQIIDPSKLPLRVTFDGSSSTDNDKMVGLISLDNFDGRDCPRRTGKDGKPCIGTYAWFILDGSKWVNFPNSSIIKYSFKNPGAYRVVIYVIDDEGQIGYREIQYQIKTCPSPPNYVPRSSWPNNLSSKPENCVVTCHRSWFFGIWGVDESFCVHADGSFDYVEGPWPKTIVIPPYAPGYDWQKGCSIKKCVGSNGKPCCYQECAGGGGANFPPPPTYNPPTIGAGWVPPNTSGCLNPQVAGTTGRDYSWWIADCLMKAGVPIPIGCISAPPTKYSFVQSMFEDVRNQAAAISVAISQAMGKIKKLIGK